MDDHHTCPCTFQYTMPTHTYICICTHTCIHLLWQEIMRSKADEPNFKEWQQWGNDTVTTAVMSILGAHYARARVSLRVRVAMDR